MMNNFQRKYKVINKKHKSLKVHVMESFPSVNNKHITIMEELMNS